MYLSEQYKMYEIAYHLVTVEGYDILYINEDGEELWLEKYEQKTSKVIRLLHKGFDWKNHLKKDIAHVFQKTKAMKQLLLGKTVEIYNVYITSHPPVDEWEILKKPLQLNEKNPPKMQVYYMEESSFQDERSRLGKDLGVQIDIDDEERTEVETEVAINHYKHHFAHILYEKGKKTKDIFTFGKPFFTYMLIAVSIMMFIILEVKGGSTNIENLIHFGAKYNPAMIDGEWWRLISSMFLHIGFLHLMMNMLALYYLGTAVERIYGSGRFLLIYFLAGIGGGLTSFVFSMSVSAGASGAIFGLFGALIFFGTIHRKIFFQTMGKNILTIIAINIVFGFAVPQIDISAHLGGLIAGFLAAAIVHLPKNKKFSMQIFAFFTYILLIAGLTTFGVQDSTNHITYQLTKIEEHIGEKDYEAVILIATNALEQPGNFEAELLFQRSVAYIELNQDHLAMEDLEESVAVKSDFPEAYYNLAILYYTGGIMDKAEDAAEKAYQLKPDDESFIKLYEQITGKRGQ